MFDKNNIKKKMIISARKANKLDTRLATQIANGEEPDSLFSESSLSHALHNEETKLYVTYLGYIDKLISTCDFIVSHCGSTKTDFYIETADKIATLKKKRNRVLVLLSNKKSIYQTIPGIKLLLDKIPVSDYFDQFDEFENEGNKDLIETFKESYLDGYNSKDKDLDKVTKAFNKAINLSEKNRASNDLKICHSKFR